MSIVVTINAKGARVETVQRLVSAILEAKYPHISISAKRVDPPESRADRFSAAVSDVEDAKSEAENLRDELQEWYDNLPDALQGGDKGSMLEEAISQLDEFIQHCEDATGIDVEFPGMYS